MFSGIGGFELGIQRAFDNEHARFGEKPEQEERAQGGQRPTDKQPVLLHDRNRAAPLCVGYSEIDKYAIKVYERQFNGDNRPDLRNGIEEIQNNSTNSTERKDRVTSGHINYGDATAIVPKLLPDFDLLVGGFPCQAFSIAGKRKGFDDTRGTLFFDIARILAEKRPRHLVLENVKGLLSHEQGKTFQTILGVLSDLGYSVEWQVLNSKDFGVPQNRERVYIVGHLGNECGRKVFPIINTHRQTVERVQGHYTNSVTKDYYATDLARIRRLTPLECERLQGFPDDWTAKGIPDCCIADGHGCGKFAEPISDTQRYKMCGNAVTVNTVQAVMERLIKHET